MLATKPYAYIVKYQTLSDAAFVARLMKRGVKMRAAQKAFAANGQSFDAGTIIIPRRNNEKIDNFDEVVQSLAKELNRELFTTMTGFVDKGKDFGSSEVNYLKAPKVAMLLENRLHHCLRGRSGISSSRNYIIRSRRSERIILRIPHGANTM